MQYTTNLDSITGAAVEEITDPADKEKITKAKTVVEKAKTVIAEQITALKDAGLKEGQILELLSQTVGQPLQIYRSSVEKIIQSSNSSEGVGGRGGFS